MEKAKLGGIYPACNLDMGYFGFIKNEEGWTSPLTWAFGIGTVIDLPVSAVTDTLFLPSDWGTKRTH
ncbi:MAG: YceK/YidQ family lipoprotein [Lentisphaerae bacterium]|nr:YceK/YidQ family lipoprotein [Lentisphaerota bacterium]